MEWAALALTVLFAIAGLVCVLLVALGVPGTWILLALAAAIELLGGGSTFGWGVIGVGVALAAVGEGIEALAGALGAKWGGATRRGAVGAFVGGIAGAIAGSLLIPVPLLGTLLGALLGTFLGALYGEWSALERRTHDANVRAAWAAVLGRLGGTLGKLAIGVVVWVVLVRAAWVSALGSP